MAELIQKSELVAAVPDLTEPWDALFVAALNSQIEREVPCLADAPAGVLAEAKLIVFNAVQRTVDAPWWVRSQTDGPFSVSYVTGGRGVLDTPARNALVALCSQSTGGAPALPMAVFPAAEDYSRLLGLRRPKGSVQIGGTS